MPALGLRSFAKINLGLRIGPRREDGFHDLATVYQTIGLHDVIRIEVARGNEIKLRCTAAGVPLDERNTCHRMAERVLRWARTRAGVTIHIEKRLPAQGGLGAASSNAAAVLAGMERLLKINIPAEKKLELAAEVGSDVPLFLMGGTVLGRGRGEEVYPLPDLPTLDCLVVMPGVKVSTPQAFGRWDEEMGDQQPGNERPGNDQQGDKRAAWKLTGGRQSVTMNEFSRTIFSALYAGECGISFGASAGARAPRGSKRKRAASGGRGEPLLLDLVRAGIENDFERVVFPLHPQLREIKRGLEAEGAGYASLSGSGGSLFGLFPSREKARKAAKRFGGQEIRAEATGFVGRKEYWKKLLIG